MGLFSNGKERTVALIDIGSSSVGGGFAHFAPGKEPVFSFSCRVDAAAHEGETVEAATLRALDALARRLVTEGAPQLMREVGSGHIESVLLSVGSPWQETRVETVRIEEPRPFVFTRGKLDAALREKLAVPEGRIRSDEAVISTSLNGYYVAKPWGRRARLAETVVLASTIDKSFANDAEKMLRTQFHAHALAMTAFAPVCVEALRELFPHQEDFLAFEVGGTDTQAVFVKKRMLAGVASAPIGLHTLTRAAAAGGHELSGDIAPSPADAAVTGWLDGIQGMLSTFARAQALPRTIFLIADQSSRDFLKRALDISSLRTLWLSSEPLSILPLTEAHLASSVRARGLAEGDLYLALLARYYARLPVS